MKSGIDVSTWNGDIDWQSVINSGVEFAIIRCGYGSPSPDQVDNKYSQNVRGCQSVGMPFGVYHYGYALSPEEARDEANFCLSILNSIQTNYPVFYDVEESSMFALGRDRLTDVINAFCEVISAAGYSAGLYMSTSYANNNVDINSIPYAKWIAQYNDTLTFNGYADIWQYSSSGSVPGISGRVDLNRGYTDFSPSNQNQDTIYVGSCNADLLNVRVSPSIDSDISFQIAKDNSVNILEVNPEGWLRINCLHGVGYCAAEYIDWPTQATGTCSADLLNVRTGAGVGYSVIYQIKSGDSVNILAQLGDWYYIDTLHGRGYCSVQYIAR